MKDPTRSLSEPGFGAALSSHKLRARAGAGLGEMSSEIGPARLFQTEPEDLLAPQPRHVVTVADVTRGLGLEATVSDRVQRMVVGSNVQYTPRAGQQRLASGRSYLIEALRVLIPAADVRGEVTRRALALWRKTQSTDGMRSPTMRTVIKAEQFFAAPRVRLVLLRKSGDGEERAGHKYLHRKPDGKGGWSYFYADSKGEHYSHEDAPSLEQAIGALHSHVSDTLNSPTKKTTDKTPDLPTTHALLDTLHASVRSTADKKAASGYLQRVIDRARTHATNMTSYSHSDTLDARAVRDALVDTLRAINGKKFGPPREKKPKAAPQPPEAPGAGKINIAVPGGAQAVEAKVFGQYAVHTDSDPNNKRDNKHVVTHVPTGMKIARESSRKDMERLARHLHETMPTALSDLSFGQGGVSTFAPEQKSQALKLKRIADAHSTLLQAEKLHKRGKLSSDALAEYKRAASE